MRAAYLNHHPRVPKLRISDGRTGWQFYQSVSDYLAWRAGLNWRPLGERFDELRFAYVAAVNRVHTAWNLEPSPACDCPYCHGAPFADQRKPVGSVPTENRTADLRRQSL